MFLILAGIIPLKSVGMARFMNKNVAGVLVPDEMINKMATDEDKTQTGIEIAANLIKELKGMCHGVHIMGHRLGEKGAANIRCGWTVTLPSQKASLT